MMNYQIICLGLFLFLDNIYGEVPCAKVLKHYGYVCQCNSSYCDTIDPVKKLPDGLFHIYETSKNSPGFTHNIGRFWSQKSTSSDFRYQINKNKTFQKVRGFGGSFTDSFGFTFSLLPKSIQDNIIRSYFSEEGIEYSVCRVVFGSSDFSVRRYNYHPEYDPLLKSFKLTYDDYKYKIGPIKRVMNFLNGNKKINKSINLFGTFWDSPAWMKTNVHKKAGFIKKEYNAPWADYYIKTLDAFKSEGIEFWALTTGNEPLMMYMIDAMPTAFLFPEDQRRWITKYLGPKLKASNYSTKIIVLDDMKTYGLWFMDVIMRSKEIENYVIGIGFHYYTDFITTEMVGDIIHKKFPNQEIIYTESSMGPLMNKALRNTSLLDNTHYDDDDVGPKLGSWERAGYYAFNIIENLNHWMTLFVDWNLALDEQGGPRFNLPLDAPIIINITNNEFYKEPMFYVLGHFSKFLRPESIIIEMVNLTEDKTKPNNELNKNRKKQISALQVDPAVFKNFIPCCSNRIQYIVGLNPNGRMTIIFYNPKYKSVSVEIEDPDKGYAHLILQPNSVTTIIYW